MRGPESLSQSQTKKRKKYHAPWAEKAAGAAGRLPQMGRLDSWLDLDLFDTARGNPMCLWARTDLDSARARDSLARRHCLVVAANARREASGS